MYVRLTDQSKALVIGDTEGWMLPRLSNPEMDIK